jgi:predicted phosphodiesterase
MSGGAPALPSVGGKAIEHFLPAGPFALLPLTGNRCSIVWTESTETAARLLALPRVLLKDELEQRFGLELGEIEILDEDVHVTAKGLKLLVVHGDQFDGVIQHSKWLAHLGDTLYQFTLWLNHHFNRLRHRLGLHYWSLSQFLKHKVKNAVSFITHFEEALAGEARRRGLDGVVCGHIHKAELREVDGILYCNDGDWVESLSALAESQDGQLQLLDWAIVLAQRSPASAPSRGVRPVSLPALPSALRPIQPVSPAKSR